MIESAPDIRFLERSEIDTGKWDDCILHAANSLIYARSFYLDSMAENWTALVEGDYQRVMPLPWNRKFMIKYLYQPYFTKTLGVFGPGSTPIEISSFLKAIPRKFIYWDIDLNENNVISSQDDQFRLTRYARTNYFVSLDDEYDRLSLQYKRLAVRMKKKAVENQLQIVKGEEPASIIQNYHRDYANLHPSITDSLYKRLVRCTEFAFNHKMADTYLAKSVSGEILAYYIILLDEKFIYSLLGGSTALGKKLGAFYLLTDAIIRDHAGSNKIFRFEGSDIPGISFFNSLFGPKKISYQHLVMNKLPFPLHYFK